LSLEYLVNGGASDDVQRHQVLVEVVSLPHLI
jgi:hypothetical protein